MFQPLSFRFASDESAKSVSFSRPTVGKHTDAFFKDWVGDGKPPLPVPTPLLTVDAQPGNISTTATLTVDGPHVVSTIDTLGDFDFFKVDLVAGQYYDIGQYLVTGGPSGIPLNDAYLELYDSSGDLIVTADGGGPNTPSGLDALLTFQATYTGTYYINARGFDQDPTNGTTGDSVGDYEIFVNHVTAGPNVYIPRYSPDSPLHSIDWGSQVDRTSRNPDGDNGPRDNGAPDTGVTYNATYDIAGKNVITYYFAKTGDVFLTEDPTVGGTTDIAIVAQGMVDWEKDAMRTALHQYEMVADIVYIEVQNRAEADFKFITYEGTPGVGASLLGRMSPPNENNEGQAEFNSGDVRWTEEGLAQGGFYFPTLIHELGHGHGMAHPHDDGGRSSIMRGAGPSDDPVGGAIGGELGDYDLSQQVFTVMSYNDGWQTSPYGMPRSGGITGTEVDHFGWQGTLAALDIAVIQDKYGVNEDWATGNDLYMIKDVNGPGTFHSTIWDADGSDEIRYDGAAAANIDLRAASLEYEAGGGGWVSFATGIYGGFTIANGVTIENATGGEGADTLTGNDSANQLAGRGGADDLHGNGGNDTIFGGVGLDNMYGGDGDDLLYIADNDGIIEGGAGYDQAIVLTTNAVNVTIETGVEYVAGNNGNDVLSAAGTTTAITIGGAGGNDTLTGGSGNDTLAGMDGTDTVNGGVGNDQLFAGTGSDNFFGGDGDDLLYILGNDGTIDGGIGYDQAIVLDTAGVSVSLSVGIEYVAGNSGNDTLNASSLSTALTLGGAGGNDIVRGGSSGDTISGAAGIDTLYGNAGADVIFGGDDNDTLFGGTGNDQLFGGNGADVCVIEDNSGIDSIAGWVNGVDKFDFTGHSSVTGFGSFAISALGSDAIVDFTGGQLYIIGAAGQIDASDFTFA